MNQGGSDAFVAELDVTDPASPQWDWSLSLGTNSNDYARAIDEDPGGAIVVGQIIGSDIRVTKLDDTNLLTPEPEIVWQTDRIG